MITFCFQDFESFSLSLFRILYQVDSLSLPLLIGLVGIYPVSLPAGYFSAFYLVNIAVLGWPFCILELPGVLFIVEFPHCGWGWMGGLSRFPG